MVEAEADRLCNAAATSGRGSAGLTVGQLRQAAEQGGRGPADGAEAAVVARSRRRSSSAIGVESSVQEVLIDVPGRRLGAASRGHHRSVAGTRVSLASAGPPPRRRWKSPCCGCPIAGPWNSQRPSIDAMGTILLAAATADEHAVAHDQHAAPRAGIRMPFSLFRKCTRSTVRLTPSARMPAALRAPTG
jgi:hypothetical protein